MLMNRFEEDAVGQSMMHILKWSFELRDII